jgi:cyclase
MQETADTLPTSEHFTIEQIADGVYAAIAREDGAALCNSGIVDLGDKTLVFDTFETPRAAQDLEQAARHLTGRPTTYVINSHFHPDHWFGNQVFAEQAMVVATHQTRERMFEVVDEIGAYKKEPARLKEILEEKQAQLDAETDERRRSILKLTVDRWQYALESLPTLEFRFPCQTFDHKLVFYGTARRAELITQGGGHTLSDAYLVLPADRVLFMGDLGFFHREPFMTHCDPKTWMAQLEAMEQADVETFVPGHGPLGTKADIDMQKQYMILLQALVAHVAQTGGAIDAAQHPLPAPFDTWFVEGTPYAENVRILYRCLTGQEASQQSDV